MPCVLLILTVLCTLFSFTALLSTATDGVTGEDGGIFEWQASDALAFDGVQVRIEGEAAMRVRYTVKAEALEALGAADVAFGVLYAREGDVDGVSSMTLDYDSGIGEFRPTDVHTVNALVYRNGIREEGVSYYRETERGVEFGVCLPVPQAQDADFLERAGDAYCVRAYLAAVVDGRATVLYLDLDSPLFFESLSLREASEHFLCNGYASTENLSRASDAQLVKAALAAESLYNDFERVREKLVQALAYTGGAAKGLAPLLEAYKAQISALPDALSAGAALTYAEALSCTGGELSVLRDVFLTSYASSGALVGELETLLAERRNAVLDTELESDADKESYARSVVYAQTKALTQMKQSLDTLAAFEPLSAEATAHLSAREGEKRLEGIFQTDSSVTLADGCELSGYLILTDGKNLSAAIGLQHFFLANHGIFLDIYTRDNPYIGDLYDASARRGIHLNEEKDADAKRYSVRYGEDGSLLITGDTCASVAGGASAFLRTYCLGAGEICVTREALGSTLVNQPCHALLDTLDLPYELIPKTAPSYDANGVLALFYARCADKPEEIASVPLYKPSDFPLSQRIELHVAVGGSDEAGDGTRQRPYATLQYAADRLAYKGRNFIISNIIITIIYI